MTILLGGNLSLSAGLRNILVHEYEEIDYNLVHKSIPIAARDLTAFMKELRSTEVSAGIGLRVCML